MAGRRGPTIHRRRLASDLRRQREVADLTLEQVAEHLGDGWSITKISRIERARIGVNETDLGKLLDLYGVEGTKRAAIMGRRKARTKGWWDAYADSIPSDYADYIELENQLNGMRCYDALTVNGLLQTGEYSREVIKAALLSLSPPAEIDRRVEVRLTRQRQLTREEDPLRFWTVIDEAALLRIVGSPETMRGQYARLLELGGLDNVTIQVLPLRMGAHPGTPGQFVIMDFPEPYDPEAVYVETMSRNGYVEEDNEVYRYRLAFDQLCAMALSPADSAAYIAEASDRLNKD